MSLHRNAKTIAVTAALALLACAAARAEDQPFEQRFERHDGERPRGRIGCEGLLGLRLPQTTIRSSQSVPAGSYQPPGSSVTYANLPAFCRVTATIAPVLGSSINIEVWLPTVTWNGKYQQSGNHGFAGTMYWGEMVPQLQRGYATAITDDGHTAGASGFDVSWAFGYPERVTDFAWRAVHELADKSKQIIQAYYGRPQAYAYFHGCSDGGREGMKSVQMFPDEFDGVIIGGTAANWTRSSQQLLAYTTNLVKAGIQGTPGAAILTLAQKAATAACDANDGVADGMIANPSRCHWDPATLVCKPGQDPGTCITPTQARAIEANIRPLRDPVDGRALFPGMAPGSEFEQIKRKRHIGLDAFSVGNFQIALGDPAWNGTTFDLHTDGPMIDRALAAINATDPDLRRFKRSGAKLIQWHGWADSSFVPGWTVQYYDQVIDRTGHRELDNVQDFYRLFMLPDVGHCGGGIGPDNIGAENQTPVSHDAEHDIVTALEQWVEHGIAPRQMIATKFNNNDAAQGVQLQRPVCPYPSEAIYNGRGDPNVANSFHCGRPRHHPGRAAYAD